VGKAKEVLLLQMSRDHGKKMLFKHFSMFFSWGPNVFILMRKEREKKGRWSNMKKSQNFLFWTYIKKNQHIHFLVHGHFSWSMLGLHIVRGPNVLKI